MNPCLYLLALGQRLYRAAEGYLWAVLDIDDDGEPDDDPVNGPID
jgi:hypothetical protein